MKKKVLIIGYGSIGKKHATLLKKFKNISTIYVMTKQKCSGFKKVNNISEVKRINPDYIIISTKTSDHFKHLNYLEKNISNKIILVEKPLYKNFKKFKVKNNKVFVGYNLRYHPVIEYIKNYINNKKIFLVNISCYSYLPNWRKNISYTKSNSAKKIYGGGALLELSHEIDYLQWIFKKIIKIKHVEIGKISNLKIDIEDRVSITGKTRLVNFFIDLNFFSLYAQRVILVHGKNFTLKGDLYSNSIEIIKKNKKKIMKYKLNKDYTYKMQHKSLLSNNFQNSCSYGEGSKLMLLFDKIRNLKN